MQLHKLTSTDGFIAFDLDATASVELGDDSVLAN